MQARKERPVKLYRCKGCGERFRGRDLSEVFEDHRSLTHFPGDRLCFVGNDELGRMMHKLQRTTFETSRAAEYFSAKELTAQTGMRSIAFATVVLKELADNALDACEKAGVSPVLGIEVRSTHSGGIEISVSDNGPGIPPKTVESILNFDSRTSSNAAYRSPTRGAQGNALKTVLGIPYALGGQQPVVIESQGIVHKIQAWATPAGDVRQNYDQERVGPTVGTKVSATVPKIGKDGARQVFTPREWARNFALFNPHATINFAGFGEYGTESEHAEFGGAKITDFYQPTASGKFTKHRPNDKISPHWYDGPSLDFLIHSHIAAYRKGRQDDLLLRDFVMQFKGLSSTTKAKQVTELLPEVKYLSDFEHKDILLGTDKLLAAMQRLTTSPKHTVLGGVGKAHFKQRFEELYGDLLNFGYKKAQGYHGHGLPLVVEFALAEVDAIGDVHAAINFSPTFANDPLSDTRLAGPAYSTFGLDDFLTKGYAHPCNDAEDDPEPITTAAAVHIIAPGLSFRERAKTRLTF